MKQTRKNESNDRQPVGRPPVEDSDPILNSEQIMAYLGIGRHALWELYRDPEFPAFRIGKRKTWAIRRSDLDLWIRMQVAKHARACRNG